MAQQTTTTLVDDLDDTVTAEETVSFGVDGTAYEIDLSAEHATALRADLATWVDHARRTGGRSRRSPTHTRDAGGTPNRMVSTLNSATPTRVGSSSPSASATRGKRRVVLIGGSVG